MRAVVAGLLGATLAGLVACTSPGGPSKPTVSVPPLSTTPRSATGAPGPSPADWPTYHGDLARTGYSPTMPAASGPLRVTHRVTLDGAVYASPIVVGGRTYVATENDSVYALDAAGTVRWRTHLGEPSPGKEHDCGNIDPLGITGTPVYDAGTNAVFVVAEYGAPPRHELVAVDARTGAVLRRTSVDLPGADPKAMQERGALTVVGGRVWIPFGGLNGDCGDYKGRVVGMPTGGGTAISFTVPTSREAGIWTPPGPVVDARGRLLVSVGNGEAGTGDRYDYSDSVLALDSAAHLADSFSPASWAADNDADKDLGSQGPALVEGWVFIAGKSGTGYVLRADHLGGIGGQVSSTDLCRSFGGTAVANNIVYVPCTDGVRAISIAGSGAIVKRWRADSVITGSPVVGGGRVWTLDTSAGTLYALDPATGARMGSVRVGSVTRFATPALSGRNVLVPTTTGLAIVAAS